MKVATPTADVAATRPTPSNSPLIIHIARRTPTVMPSDNASVMHMPGVMETTKKVGMKADNKERLRNDTWGNPIKLRMSVVWLVWILVVYRIYGYPDDTSVLRDQPLLHARQQRLPNRIVNPPA